MALKSWGSLRERLLAHKAQLDALAVMADKPPHDFVTVIDRRPRKPKTEPLALKSATTSESDVNDGIRDMQRKRADVRLYRNNRGFVETPDGGIRYGVGPAGASDWIGYRTVTVTPDMVGQRLAVFVAVEAKRPGKGADKHQQEFIDEVLAAGGLAGCAHSAHEAEAIMTKTESKSCQQRPDPDPSRF